LRIKGTPKKERDAIVHKLLQEGGDSKASRMRTRAPYPAGCSSAWQSPGRSRCGPRFC
jgi:hypothetical protein